MESSSKSREVGSTQLSLDLSTSKTTSAAQFFLKGVRRNVSDYTKFKEAKQWQQWERHKQSTASAQGVANVFNPLYVPRTDDEKALFKSATEIWISSSQTSYPVLGRNVSCLETILPDKGCTNTVVC
jgi:hypothetical protein